MPLLASGKLVWAVVDSEVLVEVDVDQPVIAASAVGVDDAADVGFASDNRLQGCLRSIWDDLGVNAIAPFEQTKDNRLSKGPSAPPTSNTPRAKV